MFFLHLLGFVPTAQRRRRMDVGDNGNKSQRYQDSLWLPEEQKTLRRGHSCLGAIMFSSKELGEEVADPRQDGATKYQTWNDHCANWITFPFQLNSSR